MTSLERFWDKVEKTDNCWNWVGKLTFYGYPRLSVKDKFNTAHRYSYATFNGPIVNDLWVLHKCNNRKCVNPEHLYLGTHLNNMQDRKVAGMYRRGVNGRTKVSEEQAQLLREVYKKFLVSYETLAKVAGVHKTAIAHIIKGS